MKKLREMKKNNEGFSLVELIVVIAIMVVLIAVLGSTILGYIEKSNYSKDVTALDSVDTAVTTYIAESGTNDFNGTLAELIEQDNDDVIVGVLSETFPDGVNFQGSSDAFEGIDSGDVNIVITNGAAYITVDSQDEDFDDYVAGVNPSAGGEGEDDAE